MNEDIFFSLGGKTANSVFRSIFSIKHFLIETLYELYFKLDIQTWTKLKYRSRTKKSCSELG